MQIDTSTTNQNMNALLIKYPEFYTGEDVALWGQLLKLLEPSSFIQASDWHSLSKCCGGVTLHIIIFITNTLWPGGVRWSPVEFGGVRWSPVKSGGVRWSKSLHRLVATGGEVQKCDEGCK